MKTKYGKWKVVGEPFNKPYEKKKVKCRCECGLKKTVYVSHLTSGASKCCRSCSNLDHGFARKEKVFKSIRRSTYSSYINMRSRCLNVSKHKAAKCYRDRPVKLCKRWLKGGFKIFLKDMGVKPSLNHSLDRVDNNNLVYSPDNCRWATPKQQMLNSRVSTYITYEGKTLNITQWAEYLGIKFGALTSRLNRDWSVKRALSTPINKYEAL